MFVQGRLDTCQPVLMNDLPVANIHFEQMGGDLGTVLAVGVHRALSPIFTIFLLQDACGPEHMRLMGQEHGLLLITGVLGTEPPTTRSLSCWRLAGCAR